MSENPYAAPGTSVLNAVCETGETPCPPFAPPQGSRTVVVTVCGLLCLAVVLVFCQTGGYDFVNYDDDQYVYDNSHIRDGMTWEDLKYYAIHYHAYTYHPLTSLSHMLDCQLYGLKASGHHITNVVLHLITTLLLFLLLQRTTGRLWPSALVAALFAIHPLRVQSVAWISERKDVLCGVFFLLTLMAYVRYVRQPPALGRYMAVCLLFVLGLLAKPMLVTLPMVLLLLDYWPLRRWQRAKCDEQWVEGGGANGPEAAISLRWLIVEKIPLLLLSLCDSALTVHTQVNAIQSLDYISWKARLANAAMAYVDYLGCFFWPRGLAILYPHPLHWNAPGSLRDCLSDHAVQGCLILAAVSAAVFFLRRKAPYLLVGWLWYLGMLVPVIGLLQVGGQKMADRYTYLPQIGIVLALVWLATDLADFLSARVAAAGRSAVRSVTALCAVGIIVALAASAWQQTGYWRNSETLWKRGLTYPNIVAHYNLGLALAAAQRHEEAIEQFAKACDITADDVDSLISYGQSLEALGRIDAAVAKYHAVLKVDRNASIANDRLAWIALGQGKEHDALVYWRHALINDPTNVSIGTQAAWLLAASPDAKVRNGPSAVALALKLVELTDSKSAAAYDVLAAAQAEKGDFTAAVQTAQQAMEMAAAGNDDKLAAEIRARLALYQADRHYRKPAATGR
jgi:tetratricopeptide (TPR) repeat protein